MPMKTERDQFPLSIAEYIADTQHLDCTQHGAYLLLMMAMRRVGGWLPDDERTLANICKVTVTRWRRICGPIRDLLLVENGRISQGRVLRDIETAKITSAKNSANGRYGGIAKSLKTQGPNVANATISPAARQESENPTPYILSESLFEIQDSKKERKTESPALRSDWPTGYADQFWALYPYRVDKQATLKILERMARQGNVSWEVLLSGVRRYAASVAGTEKRFIKHPPRWLNAGCWDDEDPPPRDPSRSEFGHPSAPSFADIALGRLNHGH